MAAAAEEAKRLRLLMEYREQLELNRAVYGREMFEWGVWMGRVGIVSTKQCSLGIQRRDNICHLFWLGRKHHCQAMKRISVRRGSTDLSIFA